MKTCVSFLLMGVLAGGVMATEIASPTEIADCVLWLDAGQGVAESGGAVSAWADQSASGDTLTQAVANRQPTLVPGAVNGRPAISFSVGPSAPADSDYLATTVLQLDTTITAFFVISPDSLPSGQGQRFAGHYDDCAFRFDGTGASMWTSGGNATLATPRAQINRFQIITYRLDNNVQLAIDGSDLTVTRGSAVVDTTDFLVGGVPNTYAPAGEYGSFDGDIAEVVIYGRPLTDSEVNQVGYYLAQKYAIPSWYYSDDEVKISYDFTGLTSSAWPGTSIYGQDGWKTVGGDTGVTLYNGSDDWHTDPGAYRANNGDGQVARPNTFEEPGDVSRISFRLRARSTGSYMMGVAMRNDATGETTCQFGLQNNNWFIREADFGTQHNAGAGLTSTSEGYLAMLVMDTAANGGNGAGSLYIQNGTTGGLLEPVAGLQDIDLGLHNMDSGMERTKQWDSLYMRMAGGGATLDDIVVIHDPPPGGTLFVIR